MKVQGACRLLLFGAICTAILLTSVITASAQNCEFSLTNAQSEVGRLFKVSLECKSTKEIAAFVAEIEYDAQALKYRSVSKENENAEYSINFLQEGKLKLAYLCEDGIECLDKAPLLEFTFKAEQAGEFKINAYVEQVIDVNGTDLEISLVQTGVVTLEESDKNPKNEKTESSVQYSEITDPSIENKIITVDGKEVDKGIIITILFTVFVLISVAVVLIYKYGIKK